MAQNNWLATDAPLSWGIYRNIPFALMGLIIIVLFYKSAKEQNLSLNPTKISGVCGRLMCCLKNEEETYEYLNSRLPAVNDTVTTEDGLKGEVHSVNVLRQTVKVVVEVGDEKEIREYDVKQLKFKPRRRKEKNGGAGKQEEQELKKLEAMEKKEGKSKLNDN